MPAGVGVGEFFAQLSFKKARSLLFKNSSNLLYCRIEGVGLNGLDSTCVAESGDLGIHRNASDNGNVVL